MSDDKWRPLFVRDSDQTEQYDALREDIPPYLDGSIWRWLMDRAAEGGYELSYRLERLLQKPLAQPGDRRHGTLHTPTQKLLDRYWKQADDPSRLQLLDAILRTMQERGADEQASDDEARDRLVAGAERLQVILAEGPSAWRVYIGLPYWGLVRRVNDTTAELVHAVSSSDTDAARKIRSAWFACYRYKPDYDLAYRDAVLAVEAVSIPLTVPKSTRATLGKVKDHIRDTVQCWSVGGLDADEIATGETLLSMIKTLWHNQERHPQRDGRIIEVSREEAEAAVSLAVLLVHWFTAGLVHKSNAQGDGS